jgi:glycosyltransferase involved in cell wall biosynthesis
LCGTGKKASFANKTVLGYVPDEELPALYSGADLFIFPSLYEGFGFPPLEAMACGCPVISSNTSSMPEVLGNACIYFDPYDTRQISHAMQDTLLNGDLLNELSKKGKNRAALFSNNRMVKDTVEVFNSLM